MHDDEKRHAFQSGLVKLAGVARQGTAARKNHGPGQVRGDAPPKLAVNKVGEPPESQTNRHGAADVIADVPLIYFFCPREQNDGDDHAQQAAMKGHAALGDF